MSVRTECRFTVANPSPYARTSYVRLPLDKLGMTEEATMLNRRDGSSTGPVTCGNLNLFRLQGAERVPVEYQIDAPFGESHPRRILVFRAENVPPGPADYSAGANEPEYLLSAASNGSAMKAERPNSLWVGHYYCRRSGSEPDDGFNLCWDSSRQHDGVKLANDKLEIYFRTSSLGVIGSLVGSATCVQVTDMLPYPRSGDYLRFPSDGEHSDAYWATLVSLSFFPPPWDTTTPIENSAFAQDGYDVVWSNSGPIRSTATLASRQSKNIELSYAHYPNNNSSNGLTRLDCRLYRVISLYNDGPLPYYDEELYVLDVNTDRPVFFTPSFAANVPHEPMETKLCRFEHIPDYFAVWKHFGPTHRGMGFASNSHVRDISIGKTSIEWKLVGADRFRCVHCFAFLPQLPKDFDPFHVVGHHAWYERAYADLRPRIAGVPFDVPVSLH